MSVLLVVVRSFRFGNAGHRALSGISHTLGARANVLSSLGAWMDTRGAWDPPEGMSLEEWRHRGTMGRDHYVRVVYRGFLFPFGHRASLIKITERKFHHKLNGNPAYLRQRMFIVVREPERSYPKTGLKTPSDESYDRQWPVVNIQITTLVTPKLDDPQLNEIATNTGQNAFWPRVNSNDFLFHLIGEDLEGNEGLILPVIAPGVSHVYHLYVVRCRHRDELRRYLADRGIATMIHYPVPPHLQSAYRGLGFGKGHFPIAEELAETSLSLPIFVGITREQVRMVTGRIREFFESAAAGREEQ